MNQTIELVVRSVLIGAGGTMAMDVWAAVLRRFGAPSLNFALLGRWLGSPSTGAGIASSKTPTPVFDSFKRLSAHTIFGVGLFLAARATASLIPASDLRSP